MSFVLMNNFKNVLKNLNLKIFRECMQGETDLLPPYLCVLMQCLNIFIF